MVKKLKVFNSSLLLFDTSKNNDEVKIVNFNNEINRMVSKKQKLTLPSNTGISSIAVYGDKMVVGGYDDLNQAPTGSLINPANAFLNIYNLTGNYGIINNVNLNDAKSNISKKYEIFKINGDKHSGVTKIKNIPDGKGIIFAGFRYRKITHEIKTEPSFSFIYKLKQI
ncbi:MAG: hypothetical protein HQK53_16350 [Oligoflexia bacterium]|nr:hypothetical protein [Oligoflexia bacterium]